MLGIVSGFLLAVGLSACSGGNGDGQSGEEATQSGAFETAQSGEISLETLGGVWNLTHISTKGEEAREVTDISMTVDEADGKYMVEDGCNNPRGTFEVGGGTVTSSPVIVTRMACVDDGVATNEDTITAVLSEIASATLSNGSQLQIASGAGVLVFEREGE